MSLSFALMMFALQAVVAVVGLLGYLALCLAYRRRWDAAIRAALSRRIGADVQWRWVSNTGYRPRWQWHVDEDASLGRMAARTAVVSGTQYATMAILGALPAFALLGLELLLNFHALVLLATAFLVIPIASIFFWQRGRPEAAQTPAGN